MRSCLTILYTKAKIMVTTDDGRYSPWIASTMILQRPQTPRFISSKSTKILSSKHSSDNDKDTVTHQYESPKTDFCVIKIKHGNEENIVYTTLVPPSCENQHEESQQKCFSKEFNDYEIKLKMTTCREYNVSVRCSNYICVSKVKNLQNYGGT